MKVGGDKLEYEGDPSLPAVSLLNTHLFQNSIISDTQKGARFTLAAIKIITYKVPCTPTNKFAYHSSISLQKYVKNTTS